MQISDEVAAKLPIWSRFGPGIGSIFFVDSNGGSDLNDGLIPLSRGNVSGTSGKISGPLATIQAAVDKCASGNNDMIVVMSGYTETLITGGSLTINKAGVYLYAAGTDSQAATFSYGSSTAASLDITAANVVLDGFRFDGTGIDALTAMINVSAAGVQFLNCSIEHADATGQATLCILTTAAANRLVVRGCEFFGSADAGTTAAIRLVGGDGALIEKCRFHGAYSSGVGAIQGLTTACTRARILDNEINNLTAGCTKAMVFVTGSTGQIAGNHMQILGGAAPITGDAMSWVGENYYAATIATAGTLI